MQYTAKVVARDLVKNADVSLKNVDLAQFKADTFIDRCFFNACLWTRFEVLSK